MLRTEGISKAEVSSLASVSYRSEPSGTGAARDCSSWCTPQPCRLARGEERRRACGLTLSTLELLACSAWCTR